MFSKITITNFMAFCVLASSVTAVPNPIARQSSPDLSLTAKLLIADSAADRYALLPTDSDYIYDFNTAGPSLPSRKNFPALTGAGVSLAYAVVPPCAMGPLHIHPRATEIFLVTAGQIHALHVAELGAGPVAPDSAARVLTADLNAGMMTVFPQGAFHITSNPTCKNATAVAAFSSDDEGFLAIVPSLFSLGDDVLGDILGGTLSAEQIDAVRETVSLAGSANKECTARCGL